MKAAHEASQHLASNFQEAGDLRGFDTHVGNTLRKDFDFFLRGVSLVELVELFEFDPASRALVKGVTEIPLFSRVGLSMVVDIAPGDPECARSGCVHL